MNFFTNKMRLINKRILCFHKVKLRSLEFCHKVLVLATAIGLVFTSKFQNISSGLKNLYLRPPINHINKKPIGPIL